MKGDNDGGILNREIVDVDLHTVDAMFFSTIVNENKKKQMEKDTHNMPLDTKSKFC